QRACVCELPQQKPRMMCNIFREQCVAFPAFERRISPFEFVVQHVHIFSRNRRSIAVIRVPSCRFVDKPSLFVLSDFVLRVSDLQFRMCNILREEQPSNSADAWRASAPEGPLALRNLRPERGSYRVSCT